MTDGVAGVVVARARALAEQRERLRRSLTARFWLRFHASLVVAGTFATGFMTNALLLQWPVHGVTLRWTIAVLAGYGAFFVLVRLWLAYVGAKPWQDDGSWIQVDGGPPAGHGGDYTGGGGLSGGGGASGDWGSSPRSEGFGIGDLGDVDAGDGTLLVVLGLIALALVAVLVGSAIHLVWIAPEMLVDAAFGAMLAAGAIPGMRRLHEQGWGAAVFRRTWTVLGAVLAIAWIAGGTFTHYFPGLRTLGEAWRMLA
jgi:hypothetical protein